MEAILEETAIGKYAGYKESGAEWLGEIPEHWECVRMKHMFRDSSIKNKPNEELLSVTQNKGVVPRSWVENRMVMPSGALESFKFIRKGDFAISLRSFEGGLEFCHHDGIISPAYTVLKSKGKFDSQFYKYLFKSTSFISELQTSVVGIREGKNISFTELSYSFLPIPSIKEQTEIANFLDRKTALIDQAIAIKEKQIKLLNERHQILIHNSVTRGLKPNAPMKDSGVEWIGEIPAHWNVVNNRSLFNERNESGNDTLPILSVSIHTAVSSEEMSDEENIRGKIRIEDKSCYKLVKPSDIVFNMMRAWQGAIGAVRTLGMVSPAYIVAAPITGINADYFEFQYRTKIFIQQMDRHSKGITDFRKRLYWNEFKSLKTVLPPMKDQIEISKYISRSSHQISNAISLKEKEIEKLKEYKATLINSVVTGKIKVV
ncbi:MAG: restriction endonuclease subunit S [Bacteroidota bacterium]